MSGVAQRPRSMAGWAQAVRAAGITDYDAACKWLREEHGLTANYSMMAASIATQTGGFQEYGDELAMLDAMYSGKKEHLRHVFDALWDVAQGMGDDVELAVCKTYASFRRAYQFAIVRPATQKAVQVNLALPPDAQPTERLTPDTSCDPNDRARWKVRLGGVEEIDGELLGWLNQACELAGGKMKRQPE